MAASQSRSRATTKYIKQHMRQYVVRFNNEREAEEIAFLDAQENVTALIKRLVRDEMRRQGSEGR